jgi:hypothetical protein
MILPVPESHFVQFLQDAKRGTYAAQDNKTKVKSVLSGSHQLEYRKGPYFYRDIYFGGDYFVGQETVYYKNEPIWGMSYAGGVNEELDAVQTPNIYNFLTEALRAVPKDAPYRGPESMVKGDFKYSNRVLGGFSRFSGVEQILYLGNLIYQLHYGGGLLK